LIYIVYGVMSAEGRVLQASNGQVTGKRRADGSMFARFRR
jgi:hypothetical protein